MPMGAHFINNKWINGSGGGFSSTDPATGETVWEGAAGDEKEVHQAVAAAADAFEGWSDTTLERRIGYLEAFAERLRLQRESLAEAICRDVGKPRWEALTEVDSMIGKIAASIDAYNDRCGPSTGKLNRAVTITRFKPHGVLAVFGPFNLPGHLPNGHIVPALLAGNTVVFKPSEQAPLTARKMVELWEAVEIPRGAINMVQGGRDTGKFLSAHPGLDGLLFTGSAAAGRAIHRAFAGRPEKILALEMGGNNPLIVHEVADVRSAAYLTVMSAFITSGQRCTCARRLIVPDGNEGDEFLDRFTALIETIRTGPYTEEPEPFMGPLISNGAAEHVLSAQQKLARAGGRALVEMKRLKNGAAMITPGLMDVTRVKDCPDEEVFGPFLQLIRVGDFDSALIEANRTAYGLAAGLISDNEEYHAKSFRRLRAGVVNWNRQTTGASARMPFGGIGASGNHRPSAYFAADYCSYPVASIEAATPLLPDKLPPGLGGQGQW